jgi:hypothetical protein
VGNNRAFTVNYRTHSTQWCSVTAEQWESLAGDTHPKSKTNQEGGCVSINATAMPYTSDTEYFDAPGLSHSGMKDLAVSPLRYWHLNLNPERPKDEPTPAMQFGSAVHCAVLEPESFLARYACEVAAADYPGCLVSMDDLRQFLRDNGFTPRGTRKTEVVEQVQGVDSRVPILEVIERRHAAANQGKVLFKREDWKRIYDAAESLRSEPRLAAILKEGRAEVPMFVKDPETGVLLKAKMDWVTSSLLLDLKTFSQTRGKSIDRSVTDAIWYEGYYRQAYLYSMIRGWPKTWSGEFVIAFVEAEPPHETRFRVLRPKTGGTANLYWERARIECRSLSRLYAECMEHFGPDKPWRYAQDIHSLADEELPGLAY